MAYMNQQRKAELAPAIKAACQKYGIKASLAVRNHSTLVLNIKEGPIDFISNFNDGQLKHSRGLPERPQVTQQHMTVNTYWYKEHFTGKALEFLTEAITAMRVGNHDNSDPMTDYFDVGWYIDINVGDWNKPYKLV